MSSIIKKYFNIIIACFILIQPIIDLITGISLHVLNFSLTLGIIIRIIFLLFIVLSSLFVYKNKKLLIPYSVIGIYSLFYLIGIIIFKDGSLFQEIQGLVKVFYFPIILISLYYLKDQIRISKATLITTLSLYLIFIFVPMFLGIGFKSYEITKAGTLGFFKSANEISGIISLLTPVMFIYFYKSKNNILKVLLALIYIIVILTMGTKTPLLALGITIMFTISYLWIKSIKKKNYKVLITSTIILFVTAIGLVLVMPKTNFYKNIETHLDYLEVDNVVEIFEDEELVDHFIFSQRLTFMEKKDKVYDNSNIYQKLFGIGYLKNEKQMKMIEMDYFDIFYSHGIIGFIIFFSISIYVLFNILKERTKITYEKYMLYVSLLLIILLSLFTGHIIVAPSVSFLAIILMLSLAKRNKKDLLFADVNLEIGGIENAQINLLNNINYNKYNVTLILEEKSGALLKRVNKNVTIKELKVSKNNNKVIRKTINLSRKLIFGLFNYDNYDFSCCYTTYSYSCNKIAKIASFNNAFYVHSNYKDVYETKEEYLEFFNSRTVDEYRKIIFVSNESAEYFEKLYPILKSKIEVFNNFIDTENIKRLSKLEIPEQKPKDNKLLVFVGRLDDSSKKVGRAINLVKEIPNLELWIIGDGPDKKKYEELANNNKVKNKVKFLGKKLNPYPYMNMADYIILTSDYEGFPVTYLESITLNKQIITTIDVSDESINIGKDYAHIISKDEKEMIEQVKKIISKTKKQKTINLNEIQNKRIKKLEKIFNEVI